MYLRILNKPLKNKQSFFLFGARGTGKSSWIRSSLKGHILIDLLESEISFILEANPQELEKFIPENFKGWVVIDEIQKVPSLLDEVHRLIEKKKYRFILTGSSARKLKRKGANLLAGRAFVYNLHPFSYLEIENKFNLTQ